MLRTILNYFKRSKEISKLVKNYENYEFTNIILFLVFILGCILCIFIGFSISNSVWEGIKYSLAFIILSDITAIHIGYIAIMIDEIFSKSLKIQDKMLLILNLHRTAPYIFFTKIEEKLKIKNFFRKLSSEEAKRYFNFTFGILSGILITIGLIIILDSFWAAFLLGLGIYIVIFFISSNDYYNFMIFYSLLDIERNISHTNRKVKSLQRTIARINRKNRSRKKF